MLEYMYIYTLLSVLGQHDARDVSSLIGHTEAELSLCRKLCRVLKVFHRPTLVLLVIAGSLRNAG